MKKLFLFLTALCFSANIFADGGIFEAYVTYGTNESAVSPKKVGDIDNQAPEVNLGTINKFQLDSFFVKVWQKDGDHFDKVSVNYKIDGGDLQAIEGAWKRDLSDSDREWGIKVDKDIVADLADGDHTLEVWFVGELTTPTTLRYLNNKDASNYKFKFKKGTPAPKVISWAIMGSFNDWTKGYALEGTDQKALTAKVPLEKNTNYLFKIIRIEDNDTTWFGLPSDNNIMKYGNCTDWVAYKSEGDANQSNVGLLTTEAGDYTFTVDVTNIVADFIVPKFSVNIPEGEAPVVTWAIMGSFNEWADGVALEGTDLSALKAKVKLAKNSNYLFKIVRIEDGEMTWFGLPNDGNVMKYGACTDWVAYKSEGDANQSNIGLLTTEEGDYTFTVDVTNKVSDNIAPKFSVNIPEGEPVVASWAIFGSFNEWKEGIALEGTDHSALKAKVKLAKNSNYLFKIVRIEDGEMTWFGLPNDGNVMKYGACTDWVAYKSEGDANQSNIGLLTTEEADYTFTVDVTNKVSDNIAPKFSVNIPEGEPVVASWAIFGSFNEWKEGIALEGTDLSALKAKVKLAKNSNYLFKIVRIEEGEMTWFGLPNDGNVMKYGACTDWVAYKSEGDVNQSNIGLLTTEEGDYTFTVDVTNKVSDNIAPKFSVNIPEGEAPVVTWAIMGTFNEWSKGVELAGENLNALSGKMALEAKTNYLFKIIRIEDNDTTWFGLPNDGNIMKYGACTDWVAYKSEGDVNQSNVGLLTTKAADYVFTVDVTNIVAENIAPKFSVAIPEPEPSTAAWFIMGSFNDWASGIELKGAANALEAKLTLEANLKYEFKFISVENNDTVWYGLPSEGNVMKYGASTDWVAYKSEGELNQANVGLLATKAGDYPFTVDVTNLDNGNIAPKFSVVIPEPEVSDATWFVIGSFNDWAAGFPLSGEANALQAKIKVAAKAYYEFKLINVEAGDTTWYGLPSEGNVMKYGACTDWLAFKSEGDQNQANVGLQTTEAGDYIFTVDPTNKAEGDILAPKFSVAIPQGDDPGLAWFIKLPFAQDDWNWHPMTEEEDGTWSYSDKWFGGGANVNTSMDDATAKYIKDEEMDFGDNQVAPEQGTECTFIWNATTQVLSVKYEKSEGIENVVYELDTNAPMYNIMGVEVDADFKGIVIQNGHKFIR